MIISLCFSLLLGFLSKVSIGSDNQIINCSSEQPDGSFTVEPHPDHPGWSRVTKKNSNGDIVEVAHVPNDRVPAYVSQGSKSNPISVDDSDSSASSPIPVGEGSASNPIPVENSEDSASDLEKEEGAKKQKNSSSNDDNGKGGGSNPSSGPSEGPSAPTGSSAPSGSYEGAGSSVGGSNNRTKEVLGSLLGLLGGFLENIPDVLNNLYL